MSKQRGRPKATVKRSRPTLYLASSNSHDDEISYIQNQPNYHYEIAETFIVSSQRQIDEPVESIAKEYNNTQHNNNKIPFALVLYRIPHPTLRQKTVVWH